METARCRSKPLSGFTRIVTAALLAAALSWAAYGRDCTLEEKNQADRLLWLNKRDIAKAIEFHLPWGAPESSRSDNSERLLVQRDYVIGYSDPLLVPLWTAHRLEAQELGKTERVDCFRRDPRIDAPFASLPTDYKEPVFDQGHLSPNGDMSRGLMPVLNSFVLSNMAPQHCQFNRGVWQIFESLVRLWVRDKGTLFVVTGSVFDRNGDGKPDEDAEVVRMVSNNGKARVAVPSHFYKVLVHQFDDGTVETLALLLPNDQTNLDGDEALEYLRKHLVSIQDVEAVAGVRLFPAVRDRLPVSASALWPINGATPRSLASNCK